MVELKEKIKEEKRREEKSYYFIQGNVPQNILPYNKNEYFDEKNQSIITLLIKEIKKLFNDNLNV